MDELFFLKESEGGRGHHTEVRDTLNFEGHLKCLGSFEIFEPIKHVEDQDVVFSCHPGNYLLDIDECLVKKAMSYIECITFEENDAEECDFDSEVVKEVSDAIFEFADANIEGLEASEAA